MTGGRFRRASWLIGSATAAVLTVLLVAAPVAGAAQTTSPASPGLPEGDDLTLADGAGDVLIGLTVRPAQPGPNSVLIYVLPLEGAGAAADVPVSLVINGQPIALDFCSRTCRTADVNLVGAEHVDIVADSPSGGTAGFDLPALPAPNGNIQLQQMQDRMRRLRTFRSDETLRPAATPVETQYAFQAPDRMRMDINNGSHTIFVGAMRYTRDDQSGIGWHAEDAGIPLPVPTFVWDARTPTATFAAAHVVGAENVDGFDTQELTFFENLGQYPFWFRLWTDADGLVHRAEMRGQGHFMDEHYSAFDAPFTIEPPT
jgi:hypothetical protein